MAYLPRNLSAFVRYQPIAFANGKPTAYRVVVAGVVVGTVEDDAGFSYYKPVTPDGTVLPCDSGYGNYHKPAYKLMQYAFDRDELPTIPDVPRTNAEWLRYIASFTQHGCATTPEHVSLCFCGNTVGYAFPIVCGKSQEDYTEDRKRDAAIFARVEKFQARYRRFCHYMKEVKPGWTYKRTVNYADNSTEIEEVGYGGEVLRSRCVMGAGGDACY